MSVGEILVTCPACQHRMSLPVAAVKRDNFYCSKCYEKVPMAGIRTSPVGEIPRRPPAPKKSSRAARR